LSHPLWELVVTYALHLYLVGKLLKEFWNCFSDI